jgi:2-oxoisovalerate dehydrogenase E2 component (dihydrolipoyl transacylase)
VPKVTMPQLGESVAEGTIGKWLKKPGDTVAKYEPLLEVITDKVNAEVPSPYEGVLKEILVEEGETVPNNAEIAVIEEAGEAGAGADATEQPSAASEADSGGAQVEPRNIEAPAPEAASTAGQTAQQKQKAEPASPEPAQGPAGSDERPERAVERPSTAGTSPMAERPAAQAATATRVDTAEPPGREDARMTPAVRRLLREHGLSPAMIVGTGGGGRISREDVLNYVEAARTGQPVGGQTPAQAPATAAPSAPAAPQAPGRGPAGGAAAPPPAAPAAPAPSFAPGEDEQLVPWTQMRKGVAKAMIHSKSTVPHAYTTVEVDVTGLVKLRESAKAAYQASEGLNLSYVPFIVKGVVEALRKHPYVNAYWSEDGLLVKRRINVGIAIAVENGLIVPVIHDADQLSINGLNRAVQELSSRARNNRLQLNDLQDGTVTVNNTGWFGSVASQSIVNTPQIAIVNMEAIVKRPVVRESPEGDVIAIRSIMNLPVAFDHRATDGAQIGRFVADVKAWLEGVGPETAIY